MLLRQADEEVRLLRMVTTRHCRFVMGLEGVALFGQVPKCPSVALLLPLGKQTLWQLVGTQGRVADEAHLRALLFQVLLGLHELHHHSIWHRDLSPSQFILFDAPFGAPFSHANEQLMLADLGASKVVQEMHTGQVMSITRTPGFGAPEYVKAQPVNKGGAPGGLARAGQAGGG